MIGGGVRGTGLVGVRIDRGAGQDGFDGDVAARDGVATLPHTSVDATTATALRCAEPATPQPVSAVEPISQRPAANAVSRCPHWLVRVSQYRTQMCFRSRPARRLTILMKIVSIRKWQVRRLVGAAAMRCSVTERESHTASACDSGVVGGRTQGFAHHRSRMPSTGPTSSPLNSASAFSPRPSGWAMRDPIRWRDRCAPAKPVRSVW